MDRYWQKLSCQSISRSTRVRTVVGSLKADLMLEMCAGASRSVAAPEDDPSALIA